MKFCEVYENFIMESLIFRARLEVNVLAEMDEKFSRRIWSGFFAKTRRGQVV